MIASSECSEQNLAFLGPQEEANVILNKPLISYTPEAYRIARDDVSSGYRNGWGCILGLSMPVRRGCSLTPSCNASSDFDHQGLSCCVARCWNEEKRFGPCRSTPGAAGFYRLARDSRVHVTRYTKQFEQCQKDEKTEMWDHRSSLSGAEWISGISLARYSFG